VSLAVAPRSQTEPNDLGERFRALFEAELRYVWTSLGRLGIEERDREDLASEVFLRVHQRIDQLDPARPPRPWLFAFAVRVASEHRRRSRARHEALGQESDAGPQAVDPRSATTDDREIVHRALGCLDMDRRAVFIMHFLDGFTIPEIARTLEIPVGTAYTRLRTARETFTEAVRRMRKAERR
jgi:RNA polymerase sigma-70 factor (ECF subfamily)